MVSAQDIRDALFAKVERLHFADGTYDLGAKAMVHRGRRGFFRDGGVYTLSVLANGGYEDNEYPDGVLYRFPQTHAPSSDRSDLAAAESCLHDHVPIFYVRRLSTGPARYQIYYPSWITAVDHASERMLIEFGQSGQPEVESHQRPGQARFRMACLQRYGLIGALCGSTEDALLVACHLYPYALGGGDDARNGLILSANHHLLFDKGLIQFSDTFAVVVRRDVQQVRFRSFGVVRRSLLHLPNLPALEAVQAARAEVHKQSEYKEVPSSWIEE